MTPVLELREVTRGFRGGGGVVGVSLGVSAGEIVALVGLNGAGKTTLMRVALGMLRPDSGMVAVAGHAVASAPPDVWKRTGHLIEAPFAYPELTVRENLVAAARLRRASVASVEGSIDEWRLRPYAERRARRLSAGNRQRVGLAAALAHGPRVVVLDEPTNTLDPAGVLILRDALTRRARDGAAILVSSHHLDEVARIADRIVVVNAGRIVGELDTGASELERVFFDAVRRDDEARSASGAIR